MKFLCSMPIQLFISYFCCYCSRDFGVVIGIEKDQSYKVCYLISVLIVNSFLMVAHLLFNILDFERGNGRTNCGDGSAA